MTTRLLLTIAVCAAAGLAQNGAGVPASGNVSLPVDEYNRLLEMAAKPPKGPDAPPVAYVIRNAQLDLAVQGETVAGSVSLEGEVFASGGVKAPLVTGMVVTAAELKGRDLPLLREAGAHQAVFTGPGDFSVNLQAALPLKLEPARASVNLVAPAAGAVRLTLSVPGEETLVQLNPGLITRRASAGGRTTITATLVPGQPASLSWSARLPAPAPAVPKETRFLSDVKTVVSVVESEVHAAALVELTVTQGEPAQFRTQLPAGFRLVDASGPTLSGQNLAGDSLTLSVSSPSARSHQFLITMAKDNAGASAEVPLTAFANAQRETGEVAVESEGAVELKATATGGLRRMDLKESSDTLRSLARGSIQAAFRYQRRASESPALSLAWTRFPDAGVLAATAQDAVATTLVTSEGRSLTEIKLTIRNQAQPFLKVTLPAGATILSAEVAGEKVKPVEGADGSRVPLLRPSFRPPESYPVSFVYIHAGAPFVKSGSAQFELPKMDVPVGVMEWEVFLPPQYRVSDFGGDAIAAELMPGAAFRVVQAAGVRAVPGLIGGVVTDSTGAAVGRAGVTVEHLGLSGSWNATTDLSGRWSIANVPAGRVRILIASPGFKSWSVIADHDALSGTALATELQAGSITASIEVTAQAVQLTAEAPQNQSSRRQNAAPPDLTASANVADLQKRVVGVLPISINVPKAGNSYKFVRPLVVEETTRLSFRYRRK